VATDSHFKNTDPKNGEVTVEEKQEAPKYAFHSHN
jgi:hypothetical protein